MAGLLMPSDDGLAERVGRHGVNLDYPDPIRDDVPIVQDTAQHVSQMGKRSPPRSMLLRTPSASCRILPQTGPLYRSALRHLISTPAPDVAALAAKISAADPFDLDHHAAILADARRLAAASQH